MTEEEIEQIKRCLQSMKAELEQLQEASRETVDPVSLDQARVGRLSRLDAIQAQQMALETARRRQHQLLKLEGALRRIESGEFGFCFICGEEIAIRRLLADPTITRCRTCAEK